MHRALHTPDVCLEILELIKEDKKKHWRRDLAHVAYVCKALSAPALDVLWRELDTLNPLIRLLPTDDETDEENMRLKLTEGGAPKALARYRQYASRVRVLQTTRSYKDIDLEAQLLHDLFNLQGGPLLPFLRQLQWEFKNYYSPDTYEKLETELAPFVTNTLRRVEITISEPRRSYLDTERDCPEEHIGVVDRALQAFLDKVSQSLSSLDALELKGSIPPLSADCVAQLDHTRSFRLHSGTLNPTSVQTLCLRTRLTKLEFDASALRTEDFKLVPGFDNLELLSVRDGELPVGIALLDNITSKRLGSFTWTTNHYTDDSLPTFVEKVSRHPLTQLAVVFRRHNRDSIRGITTFGVEEISPLLRLQALTHLEISGIDINLPNRFLENMASAWTQLELFVLRHTNDFDFRCLEFVARMCPRLQRLNLTLALNQAPASPSSLPALGHGLQRLTLRHRAGEMHMRHMVSLVHRMFPTLKTFCRNSVQDILGSYRRRYSYREVPSPWPNVKYLEWDYY